MRRLLVIGLVALIATSTAGQVAPRGQQVLSARLVAATGGASPGRTLHFSGVLTDPATGNPLSGSFTMLFGIFDAETAGTQKWTETQPGTQVKKGVFNVQLGSVTDFPADLFDTSPLYIEITINPPSAPLAPRVLIARTGNAFHADKADDVKNNAITKDKLRDKAVEREKIQDKAVNEEKINDKAVKREKIEDKAVDRSKLESKAVGKDELDIDAVDRDKLENGAVTAEKLAPGLLDGLRSQPGARAQFSVVSLTGDAATGPADVAIGVDGLPIIAAVVDWELHAIHCEDPTCTRRTDTRVDGAGGSRAAVLIGPDGLPVLFSGNAAFSCLNISCTQTSNTSSLPGWFPGPPLPSDGRAWVMGADGRPVTARVVSRHLVEVERCDLQCTSFLVGQTGSESVALTIGTDGNPVVGFLGERAQGSRPQLVRCQTLDCELTEPPVVVPLDGASSIAATVGPDGRSTFVVVQLGQGPWLVAVRCATDACDRTTSTPVLPVDTSSGVGYTPRPDAAPRVATGPDGFPVIVLPTDGGLSLVHCANRFCLPHYRER